MSAPLDLAALRLEREARQQANKKRDRSISPPSPRKAPRIETSTVSLPSGARLKSFTTTVANDQHNRKTASANAANEALKAIKPEPSDVKPEPSDIKPSLSSIPTKYGEIVYPSGVVKKTWAFKHARDGTDIKLEEVLEAQTLRTAVMSAFQWDIDWVLSKLQVPPKGGNTKCVFVMQAKEASLRARMLEDTREARAWLRLCFPPMEGQTNCMHSKLMLLFHPNKVRIAVPTANLLNFDWGETGVMENSVFIIDLPRLPEGETSSMDTLTEFGRELVYFITKQGFDQDIRDGIMKFDFSQTKDMAFVHSIGGISAGPHAEHSGVASLSRAVRKLGLDSEDVEIDFAASSIGNLKDAYLSLIHAAACGKNVFDYTTQTAAAKAASFFKASRSPPSIRDKFRIYFPTEDTVKSSTAGGAGTICLSREWFESGDFPRKCFRDYISTRPGMLSHNKLMYVRSKSEKKKKTFVYVGSANVSQSAWGTLVQNKKEKSWHVNCRNWECGVLLPVSAGDEPHIKMEDDGEDVKPAMADLSVFGIVAKPPFMVPGVEYDGAEPWYFKEKS